MRQTSHTMLLATCLVWYGVSPAHSAPVPMEAMAAAINAIYGMMPTSTRASLALQSTGTLAALAGLKMADNSRKNNINEQPEADKIRLNQLSVASRQAASAHALAHAEKYHPDGKSYDKENKKRHPGLKAAQHHAMLVDQAQTFERTATAVSATGQTAAKAASQNPQFNSVLSHRDSIVDVAEEQATKELRPPAEKSGPDRVRKLAKLKNQEAKAYASKGWRGQLTSSAADTANQVARKFTRKEIDRSGQSSPESYENHKPPGCKFECPDLEQHIVDAANRGEDVMHNHEQAVR